MPSAGLLGARAVGVDGGTDGGHGRLVRSRHVRLEGPPAGADDERSDEQGRDAERDPHRIPWASPTAPATGAMTRPGRAQRRVMAKPTVRAGAGNTIEKRVP